VQVTRPTFIPLLAPATSDRIDPAAIREEYIGDLSVVYTFGPQFGRRIVTRADLDQMAMPPIALRRAALEHLEVLASRAEFHGQPPALMLSFEGLESSLLLATDIWQRLAGTVPGDLVVGVPARDVVVVTGSNSSAGLEKARRCVERVFFAGDENLLSRSLLVRRGGVWEPFDRPVGASRSMRPGMPPIQHRGPDQPPRQFQEHPSWPGERVPVSRRPMQPPLAPAAQGTMAPGLPPRSGPPMMGPTHTGSMPPVHHTGMIPPIHQTGMMAPVPGFTGTMPAVPAFTGTMPAVPAHAAPPAVPTHAAPPVVPAHAAPPAPPTQPMPPARSAPDVAPYSAVPYSAVPYSAVPYSAIPYSAIPNSAAPQLPAPYAASEYLQSRGARPKSRDDYPSGAVPEYSRDARDFGSRSEFSRADELEIGRDDPRRDDRGWDGRGRDEYSRDAYRQDGYGRDEQRPAYPASWGSAPTPTGRQEFRTGPRARFSR
jgi:hypothetical protein